jgi:hypothetical protein
MTDLLNNNNNNNNSMSLIIILLIIIPNLTVSSLTDFSLHFGDSGLLPYPS